LRKKIWDLQSPVHLLFPNKTFILGNLLYAPCPLCDASPFFFRPFLPLMSLFFFFLNVLFVWFVGCLALCVGVTFGVSLKLFHPVLSAPPIPSAPTLPLTVRCQSFLASPHDVLSTPPSTLISGQHAIDFLLIVAILIVCFPCFFFGYFFQFCLYLLVFPLLFSYTFSSVYSFYLVVFPFLSLFFLYIFSFLFLLCNKVTSSQIVFCS
jgi:hypothetical protein